MHQSILVRLFDEAKHLADMGADGDVATLIDRGIKALAENKLDGRRYAPAAQIAGYCAYSFRSGDWDLARECANRLQVKSDAAEAIVIEAGRHRIPDMNTDMREWAAMLSRGDLVCPEPGENPENIRAWVLRVLRCISDLSEQALKNYLGIFIAVDSEDPVSAYDETQQYTLGDFSNHNETPPAVVRLLEKKGKIRMLRNARSHVANITVTEEGQILIRPRGADYEPWQPEEIEDVFKTLLQMLWALSLGVAIGAGHPYQSSAAEDISDAVAAGSDLSLIKHLLATWMEWSDVRASFHDGTITVEARSAGPVRFGTLAIASGQCNVCAAAKTLACTVTSIGDGAVRPPMTIEMPVHSRSDARPQDDPAAEERIILAMAQSVKIDGAQFLDEPPDGYGGMRRLCSDQRFWEGQDGFGLAQWSDNLESRDSFIQRPSDLWMPGPLYL